jgi:D-alanine-D-alanine ligase
MTSVESRASQRVLDRWEARRGELRPLVVTSVSTLEATGTRDTTEAVQGALGELSIGSERCAVDDPGLDAALLDAYPVVNCVHGRFGEDGQLTRLCEELGLPVTGPPASVHQRCLNKRFFKSLARAEGVRVPRDRSELASPDDVEWWVRKPVLGGGSIGLELLGPGPLGSPGDHHPDAICEEFVWGRIISSAVFPDLGRAVLPLLENHTESSLYTADQKRGRSAVEYEVFWPSTDQEQQVSSQSQRLYDALGARGILRFDWILPTEGETTPVVLECNSNPGLRPRGNCGLMVAEAGVSFRELIAALVLAACDNLVVAHGGH